jgi:Mn-dependent DtxR family transcriptional regulator
MPAPGEGDEKRVLGILYKHKEPLPAAAIAREYVFDYYTLSKLVQAGYVEAIEMPRHNYRLTDTGMKYAAKVLQMEPSVRRSRQKKGG